MLIWSKSIKSDKNKYINFFTFLYIYSLFLSRKLLQNAIVFPIVLKKY